MPLWTWLALAAGAEEGENPSDRGRAVVQPVAELGAAWIPLNDLQLGDDGTLIDLPEEGGQGRLFPTTRLRLDIPAGARGRSRFSLTWQPLEVSTRVVTPRRWRVNDTEFARGTPVEIDYGFSFFRASYQYDVLPKEEWTLGLGLNLQLRTSSLVFFAADGSAGSSQQEFGPVPSLLVRVRRDFAGGWLEAELDALPAPFEPGLYGFYELDLRAGLQDPRGFEPYLVLRGLGGGYVGPTNRGFSDSQLLVIALGAGVAVR